MVTTNDGTLGNYLSAVGTADLQTDWTMLLWVCPSGGEPPEGDGFQVIQSLNFFGATNTQLYMDIAPNILRCKYFNNTSGRDVAISGGDLSATLMTMLAITHEGGNAADATTIVYRGNGGADITNDTYLNDPVPVDSWHLFNWGGNTEPFNGEIGCVKVWERVLTLDELYFEYRRIAPGMATGLTRFYPLLDTTSPGVDRSGLGNDMTLTGALGVSRRSPVAAYQGSTTR
jgi:hypothetical protein